jgi:TIR domain
MNVGVYVDNTLPLAVRPLVDHLNALCTTVRFEAGTAPFRLTTSQLTSPTKADDLSPQLLAETKRFDLACLATSVPYDNNYFFASDGDRVIVSFSGWNLLTDLPITNGLFYILATLLLDHVGVDGAHDETTGCVNDFLWDKRGIDVGMRAAFVCGVCLGGAPDDPSTRAVIADAQAMLDALSRASRAHADVLSLAPANAREDADSYDVFLSYSSADRPAVRELNRRLAAARVRTWMDEERLPPGLPWQQELERQIGRVRAAAVCVGQERTAPWRDFEMRSFLNEFASRQCPVIPVLLPDAPAVPELPLFLQQMTWIDLRDEYESGLAKLTNWLKRS